MALLKGKKILLGLTGSIAVYKSAMLVRLLVKAGAEVQVIMSKAATTFVQPLTFSTLSKNPVYTDFVNNDGAVWNSHVELGLWADVLLIAPASANTIAKMSNGLCDNLLTAIYLSAKCPVLVAPAMDRDMWLHPSTLHNLEKLESYNNHIIPVGDGELASGLSGAGRLAEPEDIVQYLTQFFDSANTVANTSNVDNSVDKSAHAVDNVTGNVNKPNAAILSDTDSSNDLKGKKVLLTAGPTRESIDPVRFISNHSSGRMGISLAEEATRRGAEVCLVLGPTQLKPTDSRVEVVSVKSAQDMFEAVDERFDSADFIIMAAAVADFTPLTTSDKKIKKKDKGNMILELGRTKDILKTMGGRKKDSQVLVGFALETNNEVENAQRKLKSKNLDFIVLNSMREKGAGFQHNTNKITILDKHNNIQKFELKTKDAVAADIWSYAEQFV